MAFAPARVAPAVAQRLQIPVQVLLYVGLFIFAQYLVNRWQVPLPANLVGMVMLLLLIVCRVIPVSWVRAGARWLLAGIACGGGFLVVKGFEYADKFGAGINLSTNTFYMFYQIGRASCRERVSSPV